MSGPTLGLYGKYHVIRADGSSQAGKKHHGCQYFVLDLDHDPHARAALAAYRQSCQNEYPALANDLHAMLYGCAFGGTPTAELGKSNERSVPIQHGYLCPDCANSGCASCSQAVREHELYASKMRGLLSAARTRLTVLASEDFGIDDQSDAARIVADIDTFFGETP